MADDERATVAALKDARNVFRESIALHAGRLVDTAGDSVLATFPSVVEAVRSAVDVQRQLKENNDALPEDRRMRFRIGVNLGDVIEESDGTLYGDGVNIAARLEGLAEADGVMISESAHMHVRNRLDVGFEDAGTHAVKNISEPVKAYRVSKTPLGDGAGSTRSTGRRGPLGFGPRAAIGLGALIVVAAVAFGWHFTTMTAEDTADLPGELSEPPMLALPDKPSIVVLPFANISNDGAQEYFADGLTDDLITDLSKVAELFVIASNSSFSYKGKPTKIQTVAEDLGVRYVVEGSVQRNNDALRINAQLIDALTGHHMWAERYEGEIGDVFDYRDQVVRQIVTNLSVELVGAGRPLSGNAETAVPEAYDAFLLGRDFFRRGTPDDMLIGLEHFARAVDLDPSYGRAYAEMAAAYWANVKRDWEIAVGSDWQRLYENAIRTVDRALQLGTPEAFAVNAEILVMQGRHADALAEIDRAVALGPSNAVLHASRARVLNAIGRAEDAAESAKLAMRYDPHYPPEYLRLYAISQFHLERYEDAAALFKRVIGRQPDVEFDLNTLIAAYGHLGRLDEAAPILEEREVLSGHLGIPLTVQNAGFYWYGDMFAYAPEYIDRLKEGLRLAGVPEGAGEPKRYGEYKARITRSDGVYEVRGATKIGPEAAAQLVEQNALFVDVRGRLHFDLGHVPGAISLNLWGGLSEEALLARITKDDPVAFYCWGKYCPISAWASAKAASWGFARVYYFAGGVPAWEDAGLPVDVTPVPQSE